MSVVLGFRPLPPPSLLPVPPMHVAVAGKLLVGSSTWYMDLVQCYGDVQQGTLEMCAATPAVSCATEHGH